MDIGGHPPIPFGPAPSVLSVFHFPHNLLFLAGCRFLNFWSRLEALMSHVDIGGHPPIPFEPPPSVLSVFQLRHNLLFLAFFQVLNFRSHFEALNDIFLGKQEQHYISNEVLSVYNRDNMPKLRPKEVDLQIYPNETHSFSASSPRVRFFNG